ncbi:hypothetical protein PV726_48035 [Streptomyces europaeiscabiei]|uniref:hypothetical protein n=1 Tax=Streptomyces europaeiscabiei TaxID=146819 RepID=UPI0029AF99D4|nr:hypothetical protein [Streptomyces europaeiscabiei]MDX3697783.1 hypothetical protein [Streptomyces europaeiscabiei]
MALTRPQTIRVGFVSAEERAARAEAEPLPAPKHVYATDQLRLLGGPEAAGELIAQQHRLAAEKEPRDQRKYVSQSACS